MTAAEAVTLAAALLGTGGIVGAVVAIIKLRPEAGQIVVQSAEGAVIVQSGVIATLRAEVERLQERVTEIETIAETAEARTQQLESENRYLRTRVGHLESENIELRGEIAILREQQNGNGHS